MRALTRTAAPEEQVCPSVQGHGRRMYGNATVQQHRLRKCNPQHRAQCHPRIRRIPVQFRPDVREQAVRIHPVYRSPRQSLELHHIAADIRPALQGYEYHVPQIGVGLVQFPASQPFRDAFGSIEGKYQAAAIHSLEVPERWKQFVSIHPSRKKQPEIQPGHPVIFHVLHQ